MADIDQTNIYSYRGNSFMLDFEKYLFDHGITVDEIELMNGIRSWPLWLARAGFFGSTSAWAGVGGRTFAWGVKLGGGKNARPNCQPTLADSICTRRSIHSAPF